MNAAARIRQLERAARRGLRRAAEAQAVYRFQYGVTPEAQAAEQAARAAGARILRFDYGSRGAA
jgi:hypothetical protein